MPLISNQGAQIYWDEQGDGDPILLIMGLGYPSVMWFRTRPFLTEHYRTIALDNRGVGHSDVPPGPYSISRMASDAAAVLDASGFEQAHVYGVSMGGMIAQEFALQYPGRARSLILGCTSPGGKHVVRADPDVVEFLMRQNPSVEESLEGSVPFLYSAHTSRQLIDEDLALRKQWLPKREAFAAQLQGILAWESYSRLDQISVPTLVLHGDSDRLIPPGNSQLIAERIRGSKLVILPQAGHLYTTDQSSSAQTAVIDFLFQVDKLQANGVSTTSR